MTPETSRFLSNQNGIILLGQSAIDSANNQDTLMRDISTLNSRMKSSTILGETIDVSGGSSVRVQTAVDKTIMGVFDNEVAKRYGFDATDTLGVNYTLTDRSDRARVRGLFRSEGINISDSVVDDAASVVIIPQTTYSRGLTTSAHTTPFHEIGHTISTLSGTQKAFGFFQDEQSRLIQQYGSLEQAPLMERLRVFHTGMALHGAEEAFAEGFGMIASAQMQESTLAGGSVKTGQRILGDIKNGISRVSYLAGDSFTAGYGAEDFIRMFPEVLKNSYYTAMNQRDLHITPAQSLFSITSNSLAEESFVGNILSDKNPLSRNLDAQSAVAHNILKINDARVASDEMGIGFAGLFRELTQQEMQQEGLKKGSVLKALVQISKEDTLKTPLERDALTATLDIDKTGFGKLITRSRMRGGMSAGTLENLIKSSLNAANVMR